MYLAANRPGHKSVKYFSKCLLACWFTASCLGVECDLSMVIPYVWSFPMQELMGSMMVSSPLLPNCGTLFHLLFSGSFNLLSFKRQVYHHLRDQMACVFVSPIFSLYMNIYTYIHTYIHKYILCPFLIILAINFVITFHFLFLRDADSRKGSIFPFCSNSYVKIMLQTGNFFLYNFCFYWVTSQLI